MPYPRFRCAVPEELLPGSLAEVTGRRDGISAKAIERTRALNAEHLSQLYGFQGIPIPGALSLNIFKGGGGGGGSPGKPQTSTGQVEDPEKAAREAALRTEAVAERALVTGTALIFAYLYHARLLKNSEVAERQYQTSLYFAQRRSELNAAADEGTDSAEQERRKAGVGAIEPRFDELVSKFVVLLRTDNMRADRFWLDRGRLWRLIFLQSPHGYWCAGDSRFLCTFFARTPRAIIHWASLLPGRLLIDASCTFHHQPLLFAAASLALRDPTSGIAPALLSCPTAKFPPAGRIPSTYDEDCSPDVRCVRAGGVLATTYVLRGDMMSYGIKPRVRFLPSCFSAVVTLLCGFARL